MNVWKWLRVLFSMFALNRLRERSLMLYLKALQGIRKSLRAVFLLLIFSQFFLVGLVLTIYSGIQLLPADEELRNYLLLGVGLGFMVLSVSAALYLTSDSFWFRLSGVQGQFEKRD